MVPSVLDSKILILRKHLRYASTFGLVDTTLTQLGSFPLSIKNQFYFSDLIPNSLFFFTIQREKVFIIYCLEGHCDVSFQILTFRLKSILALNMILPLHILRKDGSLK